MIIISIIILAEGKIRTAVVAAVVTRIPRRRPGMIILARDGTTRDFSIDHSRIIHSKYANNRIVVRCYTMPAKPCTAMRCDASSRVR